MVIEQVSRQSVPGADLTAPPILEMVGISKRFPGTLALDRVNLAVRPAEIHALVGQNGAGKSTLVKILAGDYLASSGAISIDGRPVTIHGPRGARQLGIGIVYQELSLLPNLTVAENLCLGREPRRGLSIDSRRLLREATAALEALGLERIDLQSRIGHLSLPTRQLVEIAKVLAQHPRILILDEPTAALAPADSDRLFEALARARAGGVGIIYISHRFQEILAVCDRGTVLRNGRVVATFASRDTSLEQLVEWTLGQKPDRYVQTLPQDAATTSEPVLAVSDLAVGDRIKEVSFQVSPGEIVGLCGLLGAGQDEVARALFGDQPAVRGVILWKGQPVLVHSPRQAKKLGIGFLTENRRDEGLIPDMAVRQNISLAGLHTLTWARWLPLVRRGKERIATGTAAARTNVQMGALGRPIRLLSGGNQQKALLARWLMLDAELFVFLEPTRGVDVGAKAEIHRQLAALALAGKAVLVVSSDVPEILALARRILVMARGRLVAVLDGTRATEEQVLMAMQGGYPHAS
ncbi:MAG TPA: sugar ABC transporter ATP-binding protein [Chloroflexota bacterium]|nr:sugar ABC transporter ATP-binding protein [Chloroflexota bacterium]